MLISAADILYLLGWNLDEVVKKPVQKQLFVELNTEEQSVYSYLQKQGQTMLDSIALACKLPIHKVAPVLLQMEMKGVVKPLPGKMFEAV